MNFDFSEEQGLFRATVERFAEGIDTAARRRLRSAEGGYERQRWRELAALGLIALAASAEHGGLGGSPVDLAVVGEALGKAIAPDPWLENGVLPTRLLDAAGAHEVLSRVMSGEHFVAVALAERQARYSLVPVQTRATPGTGGGYVLSGEKIAVLGGAMADSFVISADLAGERAFFLVPAAHQGLERRNYRLVDGSMACELRLRDALLPAEAQLHLAAGALERIVADVRLLAAAEMLGLGQRLFSDTLDYVRQREQFGVAIGTFQALQHRLVDCYAMIEQSRSMLYRAMLQDRDDAPAWRRVTAGAKTFIGECAAHIAREAVQMHGGMGITDELAVGHAMKRGLLLRPLLGDSDVTLADYAAAA